MFWFTKEEPDLRSIELIMLPSCKPQPDTRPARRFHPAWMYCRVHNGCDEPLFVYGPRHSSDTTTMPTSLFLLESGRSTPKRWDCKGILIPSDRHAINGRSVVCGPVALKYRDLRSANIQIKDGYYQCPKSDDFLAPGQIDYTVPTVLSHELLRIPRRRVEV